MIYRLYLFIGSYLAQFNPCGYSHFSLSIHSVSCCLRDCSMFSGVLSVWGNLYSSCMVMLFMLPHSPLLKCSWRTPGRCLSLIACMCLANLAFRDCVVCPTYCRSQFLHCIRYTMLGVSHVAVICPSRYLAAHLSGGD